MTVSMKVMHAGSGVEYFLKSVVAGDGDRNLRTPLTRYYTEAGTPPGRWIGSGVEHLGSDDFGRIHAGQEVTEEQLRLLIEQGQDPVTGERLGKAFFTFTPGPDAVGKTRAAVHAYDLTFSVNKSVSVLWAVADAGVQEQIGMAHHEAVAEVMAYFEKHVAATRVGLGSRKGAVGQVDTLGIVAAAYDHYDSRAGDPHLHTHVVVSAKVRTARDGVWRSLDGRPVHAATVALSELYQAILADKLTARLDLSWEQRVRNRERNRAWELHIVPDGLVRLFSGRAREIDEEKDRLIARYKTEHSRAPSKRTILQLRQQATLSTRPAKKRDQSLADLTQRWRERLGRAVGKDATVWARERPRTDQRPMVYRFDDLRPIAFEKFAALVLANVAEKRSTWRHWNLVAEAARQTMGVRFATAFDREQVLEAIVTEAERQSIRLTPDDAGPTPGVFRRADGTSIFRPKDMVQFSSADQLAAEHRLLRLAEDTTGPRVPLARLDDVAYRLVGGGRLRRDQADALGLIATSGRVIDVLIGPAGAGKTMAMLALKTAWETEHGAGAVVGLSPSAVAAEVLSQDLGQACENTAKWVHEHSAGRTTLRAGQLVIVDEASLAGTRTVDYITQTAKQAGAKVLLVGDWAQLQAVDAGGAFTMLAQARENTPELTGVHRFTADWEKLASLDLRHARTDVIDTYIARGRVREGTLEQSLDAAYIAWRADQARGLTSILVAESNETVRTLNERARAERILSGRVEAGREVRLSDGTAASVGDWVITRRNDRRLRTGDGGWVRNGEHWTVTAVRTDGSVTVRPRGYTRGNAVVLPAAYVAEHVDLGYAVTAHRAQGVTVDTSHVVVTVATTRENLYVSMTRGRGSNIAYVAVDQSDDAHAPAPAKGTTARTVLYGVLHHSGAELSATQTATAERLLYGSVDQLAAEYAIIAAEAQRPRWERVVRERSGLAPEIAERIITSPAFGPLTASLRRVEAHGYDVERVLFEKVGEQGLLDASDVAAVLRYRSERRTQARPAHEGMSLHNDRRRDGNFVCGFIPKALGPTSPELRAALDDREHAIVKRALQIAQRAVRSGEAWASSFGPEPPGEFHRTIWLTKLANIAAFRDRHGIDHDLPLGPSPASDVEALDRRQLEWTLAGMPSHRPRPPREVARREPVHRRDHGRSSSIESGRSMGI